MCRGGIINETVRGLSHSGSPPPPSVTTTTAGCHETRRRRRMSRRITSHGVDESFLHVEE